MDDFWQGNVGFRDTNGGTGKLMQTLQIRHLLRSQAVNVTNTATLIPSAPLSLRRVISILNNSSATLYIGGVGVTTAAGYPLTPQAEIRIEIADDVDVYAIASAAGPYEIRIIEGA